MKLLADSHWCAAMMTAKTLCSCTNKVSLCAEPFPVKARGSAKQAQTAQGTWLLKFKVSSELPYEAPPAHSPFIYAQPGLY